jgi:hypothetical protein
MAMGNPPFVDEFPINAPLNTSICGGFPSHVDIRGIKCGVNPQVIF